MSITMNTTSNSSRRVIRLSVLCVLIAAGALSSRVDLLGQRGRGRGGPGPGPEPAQGRGPRLDPGRELALKITAAWTVASVGDIIDILPIAALADPPFQNAIKIVRDADIAVGNMEANIVDWDTFDGPLGNMTGSKGVAADVKAMGFDLVNRANNHTFDSGVEGFLETQKRLDEVGIVHAGTGNSLEEANAARFLQTSKGRVGIVGMYSTGGTSEQGATSRYEVGNLGASSRPRPGLNALRVNPSRIVSADQLAALIKVRETFNTVLGNPVAPAPSTVPTSLQLFGTSYQVGPNPGEIVYSMNQDDLQNILRSVRNGKYYADFMIATIHSHEGGIDSDKAPEFLVELAHKAIDNGADVFVGHGPHVLRGIEIYKGKPIFYGEGEFIRQLHMSLPDRARYTYANTDPATTELTGAEAVYNWRSDREMFKPENLEGMVAESRFEAGRLVEVRLHPTVAGYNLPFSQMGVPRIPSPETARRILERLQLLSKPFGTTIAIEGNVGVIRVVPASQPATGQR